MRLHFVLLLSTILASGFSAAAHSQENSPAVTDLTMANVLSIQIDDIIDALAPARGTRIEPGAPPTVRLPVYFEFDSDRLQPDAVVLLERVGAALSAEELAAFRFSVEGHTDSVGQAEYNDGLSQRRAVAVERFLADSGVPAERLEAVGRGEVAPVALNDNSTGRKRNRRVELINLGAQP
jgi:outer membrane protein OmpA-like peptidoglycan-associated protein